ncbi:MAG: GNAT family N-acetyltransferase [Anaerolineae bacterium]
MTNDRLTEIYNQDQRINVVYPNIRREVLPELVRHVNLLPGGSGFIIYTHLGDDAVEQTIREQVAYFEGIGQDFEWKWFDTDSPPDLAERLAAYGFELEEPEAIMVLPLAEAPPRLLAPVTIRVERLTDPARFALPRQIEEAVWHSDHGPLMEELAGILRDSPEQISMLVAYVDDTPAACAWAFFPPNSRFVSLWGGSTLPEFRGRGLYTALLAVRVQEAIQRGREFATVDAGPMSRPILEQQGFRVLGYSRPAVWRVGRR